ncbi:MAG: MerR HTH family regulatory protein [Rhodobacteraceae bacterium HLUCCO18]|nr:MAG: MerR HTH family regulatory protein [Rhodobacteraceae bacterium HLUCCO18]
MSLGEKDVVARVERVTLRELRLWVREGWVRPLTGEAGPVFDEVDIARVHLLCELRKDMALPNDALPTVLTLLDHLHRVRRDLRHLTEALEEQPPDVRRSVIDAVRRRAGTGDEGASS